MQDSTARVPDADPAASSFPRVPLPDSADIPEAILQRYDEVEEGCDHDVRQALLQVLAVLDRGDLVPELTGSLRPLECHGPGFVHVVLRSLDDLVADQ